MYQAIQECEDWRKEWLSNNDSSDPNQLKINVGGNKKTDDKTANPICGFLLYNLNIEKNESLSLLNSYKTLECKEEFLFQE